MIKVENLPPEWLTERTTRDELIDRFSDLPSSIRTVAIQDVSEFASYMIVDDELWMYSTPPDSWERNCGSSGLAIVRQGQVVNACQLMMN